jgi:hypothetical protein
LKDIEVLEHLRERAEKGVSFLQAGNGQKIPVVEFTTSKRGTSLSTISRNNNEIMAAMEAQGDFDTRARELVVTPKFAAAAISELYIPGRLGPKESTDLVTTLSLTLEQTRGLRQAGFGLASEKTMAQEEASRQLAMQHRNVLLHAKPREREAYETIEVKDFFQICSGPPKLSTLILDIREKIM